MKISVREDFTKTPGHRSRDDGPFSGELFLDEVLRPAFLAARKNNEPLQVDLDGTSGYATSFLEASFGGLAREFAIDEVRSRIRIQCSNEPYLAEEVESYILEARNPK